MAPPTEETYERLCDLHPEDPGGASPIPSALRRQGKEWAREVVIDQDDVLTAVGELQMEGCVYQNGQRFLLL